MRARLSPLAIRLANAAIASGNTRRLELIMFYARKFILPIILCSGLFCSACDQLDARDHAEKGRQNLENCEFESAYLNFKEAHDLYPSHHDILIGFALSELLWFADSPEVQNTLKQFGFNSTLSSLCTDNPDSSNNSDKTCTTCEISDLPASENSFSFSVQNIDPALTWTDVVHSLSAHIDILENAAEHFSEIASFIDPEDPWRTSAFGHDNIAFHKADFAAVSFAAYLLASVIRILNKYQFDFSVRDSISAFQNNDNQYFSGEEIARQLQVSRSAVWKAIKSLQKEGYNIDAISNKGYALVKDYGSYADFAVLRTNPEQENLGINAALVDSILSFFNEINLLITKSKKYEE